MVLLQTQQASTIPVLLLLLPSQISASIFDSNNATYGGALECVSCLDVTLTGLTLINNTASSAGALALVYVEGGILSNSLLYNNSARTNGVTSG